MPGARIYPYRTTTDKLEQTVDRIITQDGDWVLGQHYAGGRDWILICRHGEPTVADLTAAELTAAIADGVDQALQRQASRKPVPAKPQPATEEAAR